MGMKLCKECGTELSSKAKTCPKCGLDQRNFYSKHKVLMTVLVVISVVTIGLAIGEDDNNTKITSSDTVAQVEKTQKNTEKKVNVGETIQTDEVKITFKSASDYTKYSSYFKPKDGNKIVRAEFEFVNIYNGDVYLENMECYADGEKCEGYFYPDDYKSPALESLSVGKKMTAILYYEVPKTAQEIVLEYESNYWTDEKVEFVIK